MYKKFIRHNTECYACRWHIENFFLTRGYCQMAQDCSSDEVCMYYEPKITGSDDDEEE